MTANTSLGDGVLHVRQRCSSFRRSRVSFVRPSPWLSFTLVAHLLWKIQAQSRFASIRPVLTDDLTRTQVVRIHHASLCKQKSVADLLKLFLWFGTGLASICHQVSAIAAQLRMVRIRLSSSLTTGPDTEERWAFWWYTACAIQICRPVLLRHHFWLFQLFGELVGTFVENIASSPWPTGEIRHRGAVVAAGGESLPCRTSFS